MNIPDNLKLLNSQIEQLNNSNALLWKEIRKMQGTDKDKKSVLSSGSYYAKIIPTYHEQHQAVSLEIFVSDTRIKLEQVVELEQYAAMFKRNRKELELFLVVNNFDPFNFNQIELVKFELKISKGSSDSHAPVIKDIHAVGFWRNSFIEVDGDKIYG